MAFSSKRRNTQLMKDRASVYIHDRGAEICTTKITTDVFFHDEVFINSPLPSEMRKGEKKVKNSRSLVNEWLENIARKIETALDQFLIAFENTILMFDAHYIIIARGRQRGEELCPIHIAEARKTRYLPAHALR